MIIGVQAFSENKNVEEAVDGRLCGGLKPSSHRYILQRIPDATVALPLAKGFLRGLAISWEFWTKRLPARLRDLLDRRYDGSSHVITPNGLVTGGRAPVVFLSEARSLQGEA